MEECMHFIPLVVTCFHNSSNYVDQATAQSLNLSFVGSNSFIMRADDTTVLSASGPGRNSIRIKSVQTYTHHVVV